MSIGSLEIWISPPKGWSSSRIRKMAPETARAETIKATANPTVSLYATAKKAQSKT